MARAAALALTFLVVAPGAAQFSALNRLELQAGNTPFTKPVGLTTAFQQLNLRYDAGDLQLALRAEQFLTGKLESPGGTSVGDRRYANLSQVRASFSRSGFTARAGHFYDILGRGLLLRGFEIPGATYEDAAFRIRQSFQRDIEGASVSFASRRFEFQALRGRPLVSVLPPTLSRSDRRPDLVSAVSGSVRPGPVQIGGVWLRHESDAKDSDFGSIFVNWSGLDGLSAYVELARELGQDGGLLEGRHALYTSVSFGRPGVGGSLEYKDYTDFFLGSGFNDPPSLVREHSWVVLNRSTHVLNVVQETGFQLELYASSGKAGSVIVNGTRAVNDFGQDFVYREFFVEYTAPALGVMTAKAFVDLAEDPLKGHSGRTAAGVYLDRRLANGWSVSVSGEAQRFDREFIEPAEAHNLVGGVTVSLSSKYSAGLVIERSTDVFMTDDPRTPAIEEDARYWLGANLGWRPNRRHSLALFGGTRRGGPACTSGICYEVLDFTGAELRITSRF
ncbi:MAG: hypothetical protein ACI9W4_000603 [Rhodothermales bacterium]|jgi:hypothetical protein